MYMFSFKVLMGKCVCPEFNMYRPNLSQDQLANRQLVNVY